MNQELKSRYVQIKGLCNHSNYPKSSNVEQYSIRSGKWEYQANFSELGYNISIQNQGIRVEYPSEDFLRLEKEHFKQIQL